MGDEDDWFERAIEDEEDEEDEVPDEQWSTEDPDDPATEEREPEGDDEWFESGVADDSPASSDDTATDRDTGEPEPPGTSAVADIPSEDDDGLFEEGFATALENAGSTELGTDSGGDPDLDFGLGGTDETDFDEEIDSELPRIDLGIEGLDGMIQGGVPERSLMVAIGGAGTGKTTFGLQFLNHGLERDESAVFITLEESRGRLLNTAVEKGYPFDEYEEEGRLAVVDLDPVEMARSLTSIRSELPRLVEEFGATRLVLDSVSLLEMMYEDQAKRRNEIYDFARSLKEAGVTALLTSEVSPESPYASRYGIVEYLTDAVFVLQYVRPDDFQETRMAIEIQKIRDANHSREKKPYEITSEGISVYQRANLF